MIMDAIAELMDIKSKSEQEKLHFNVPFAAEKESTKGKVLFENTKSALDLNGSVDAEQNTFIADNVVKRLTAML